MSGRGGRKPGAQNRRTRFAIERLEALGVDPLQVLADIAAGRDLDGQRPSVGDRVTAARELAKLSYSRPTPRPEPLDLGAIVTADEVDLRPAVGAIFNALGDGAITPAEAGQLLAGLQVARAVVDRECDAQRPGLDLAELGFGGL